MSDGTGTKFVVTPKALDDPSFLVELLGPDWEAKLNRDLTPDEESWVDESVARHGGSHAAALGVTDPALASQIDALFR